MAPRGQSHDVVHAVDAASEHVEAHRAHTKFAELGDFGVGMVVRNLRDADPTGAEPRQDVHQIGLVVGLERARHHRTGDDAQRLDLSEIIFERKVRRRVALVRHDREAVIDDVAMAVEQPALLSFAPGGAQRNGGAAREETATAQMHRFTPGFCVIASPFVPAKAGTQSQALDSRLRGNER